MKINVMIYILSYSPVKNRNVTVLVCVHLKHPLMTTQNIFSQRNTTFYGSIAKWTTILHFVQVRCPFKQDKG